MKIHDDALSKLGARIRSLREARGMKLKQLADATALSDAFVSRLERGQGWSIIRTLRSVAAADHLEHAVKCLRG